MSLQPSVISRMKKQWKKMKSFQVDAQTQNRQAWCWNSNDIFIRLLRSSSWFQREVELKIAVPWEAVIGPFCARNCATLYPLHPSVGFLFYRSEKALFFSEVEVEINESLFFLKGMVACISIYPTYLFHVLPLQLSLKLKLP